jgi:nicotinamidase-related amidase
MLLLPRTAALIVIDVQAGFDSPYWGRRNNPDAEANIGRLLEAWRASDRPVFHIQHLSTTDGSPLVPGGSGCEFKEFAKPLWHEPVVTKKVNSAFIGTDLEQRLRGRGIATLVVCGLTTNHCVETTTRMAGNLGFQTYLVGDAAATFDRVGPDGVTYPAEQVHAMSLANLHGEFATVIDTAAALDALV